MNLGKRAYWVVALVAILALAGAAVTLTSRMTAAGGGDTPAATQDCQDQGPDDAQETEGATDTDAIEQECGPDDGDTNETESANDDDANEVGNAGKLDDGADLLSQAGITVEEAIAAAQGAVTGNIGEIDLEQYHGKLVFNVDVGDKDVKVDASNGSVLATDTSD